MYGLSFADLERLAAAGRDERVAAREVVPLDGPTVVAVIAGTLRVYRDAAFVRDVTLCLARAGDVLGAGALFGERSSESAAQAIGPARVVRLAREAVEAIAADDPAFYVRLARSLGRRTSIVQAKLEAVSRAGVEARVAAALLEIAGDSAPPSGTKLELSLSQEDLARLAGTTRESASSAVATLARAGLVRGGRLRGLVLTDPAGLAERAQAG